MKIEIVVFDGFDEMDAIGPFEVLRNLAAMRDDVEVRLVSPVPRETVTAAHGLAVGIEGVLGDDADLVLVPGGGWADDAGTGVRAEIERGVIGQRLQAVQAAGGTIASVCTGAMVLSAAGLTRGRPATTHWVARDALAAEGAMLVDERVVDDGDLLTCGGVTSGLDLALWIVERSHGAKAAQAIAREMEYERRGEVHVSAPRPHS